MHHLYIIICFIVSVSFVALVSPGSFFVMDTHVIVSVSYSSLLLPLYIYNHLFQLFSVHSRQYIISCSMLGYFGYFAPFVLCP